MVDAKKEEFEAAMKRENSHCQWNKLGIVFATFFAICIGQMLRGSVKAPSLINLSRCGTAGWSIFLFIIVLCSSLAWKGLSIARREHEEVVRLGLPEGKGDIDWTSFNKCRLVLTLAFLGGVFAGGLGAGGGVVYSWI